ncbi:MAG: type II toxin-antitoxin system PemK/MazF family toxin [Promicromonosporaceae bacterium]|nr:type II toxin-antitoxin system PemK/MazF family toxin [Promicromonosporaceae bacterium]
MVAGFTISRGDVCWYDYGEPIGSLPAKRRPTVVVQSDDYNRSELATTIVVPLTSATAYAAYGDNVFVPAIASGLEKDSVALPFQATVVNKVQLEYPVGRIPSTLMRHLASGLAAVFAID